MNTTDDVVYVEQHLLSEYSTHNFEEIKDLFRKRTKQNLKDISFQNNSDNDGVWIPQEKYECNWQS